MPKNKPELLVWGGTGNMKVLVDMLSPKFRLVGFFDNDENVTKEYRGLKWLGNLDAFRGWIPERQSNEPLHFIVSIGPGKGMDRLVIHDEMKSLGLIAIKAVHPSAFVSDTVEMGEGSQVFANATVSTDVVIGRACIVNTSASVDHECIIEDGATIGPGATLAGLVHVAARADIYAGAIVLPRVRVGREAVVGAGAVVLHDVPDRAVVVGNPARIVR